MGSIYEEKKCNSWVIESEKNGTHDKNQQVGIGQEFEKE